MEEIRDYYAFLGVPCSATADDIKRAYARKRREYQNDETKTTQLNQAYEVLCDSTKRKQYDLNMQFGNQVEDIKEKIRNSETLEQRDKYLIDAKKIYLDIIKTDAENVDALWNLVGIEELLGNDEQAVQYLKQLEKYVEGDDKLQVYHRLGEIYSKLDKIEEAIKSYHAIYKTDASYVEDVKILVRLYYEDKMNIKAAIQILNDCINRSSDSRLKIVYLYETLRGIRLLKISSYQKVEEALYKKLETFRTDNEESNLVNASTILTCFKDVIDREDFDCFHRMEQVYQIYDIKHTELNQAFKAVQQIVALMEKGKVHKVIKLYLEKQWTKEIRGRLGKLIIKEAEQIKASLECIKKEALEYWKSETELVDLEKLINENLSASKEFNSLSNDTSISYYIKKMIECILLDGIVEFEEMKDEFIEARDSFFEKEDRAKLQHTLRKVEEYYPICYKLFADFFFEGKTVEELFTNNHTKAVEQTSTSNLNTLPYFPDAKDGYVHRPYISGWIELLFIIVCTFCFPPALPIILITKYYDRHKKKIKKIIKRIIIASCIIAIIAIVYKVGGGIKDYKEAKQEEEYNENHNFFLSDNDKEERDELDIKYSKLTDVDIHVTQSHVNDEVTYPDEDYVWLIIWDYGYQTEYELKSNYLSDDEWNGLWEEVIQLYKGDNTDGEKCENFYILAYKYVTVHFQNYFTMPDLVGMSIEDAYKMANETGFFIEVSESEYSDTYKKNIITYQYTYMGSEVQKGNYVYVNISKGKDNSVIVPYLVGLSLDEARAKMEELGLQIEVISKEYSELYGIDVILEQNILEDTKLYQGDVVELTVSLGEKEPIFVYPEDYFALQRLSLQRNISHTDILDFFQINEQFCDIILEGIIDEYEKYVISFPSFFYDEEGITNCEIYISSDSANNSLIYCQWEAKRGFAFDNIYSTLLYNGYVDGYTQRGILVETEAGAIDIEAFRSGKCYLRFSAY